jgi:hypothetical protein
MFLHAPYDKGVLENPHRKQLDRDRRASPTIYEGKEGLMHCTT